MNVDQVQEATQTDLILLRVPRSVMTVNWADEQIALEIMPYFHKEHKITVENGCLLWGIQVIISMHLCKRLLYELHTGYPGIVQIKSLS